MYEKNRPKQSIVCFKGCFKCYPLHIIWKLNNLWHAGFNCLGFTVVILAAIACSTAFSTAFSTSFSSDSRGYIFKVAGDSGCRLHWTWTGVGRGSILLTGCQTGGVFSFNFAVRGHQHTCTDPNTRVETPTLSLKKCIHTGAWAEISVLCTRRLSGMQWNFCEKHPLTPPPTQPLHLCVCVCVCLG